MFLINIFPNVIVMLALATSIFCNSFTLIKTKQSFLQDSPI